MHFTESFRAYTRDSQEVEARVTVEFDPTRTDFNSSTRSGNEAHAHDIALSVIHLICAHAEQQASLWGLHYASPRHLLNPRGYARLQELIAGIRHDDFKLAGVTVQRIVPLQSVHPMR